MKIILANSGGYPRIGDEPEKQVLRKAIADWERGILNDEKLKEVEDLVVKEVVQEQIKAGLDVITDGLIRWYCPFSHIAEKLNGVKINGLLRYFDTNFYFRQPVAIGKIKRDKPIITPEYEYAKSISTKPVKAVLTGPYTLAKYTIIETDKYKNIEDIAIDYAIALSEEIEELSGKGAELIQIDEPAILMNKKELPVLRRCLEIIWERKGTSKIALFTYFGDVKPLYSELQKLRVDILGIDFTYSSNLTDYIITEGTDKNLALGLIDGRNTKIEDIKKIAEEAGRIISSLKLEEVYINPSCGLELLPRDRAYIKLVNMCRIREYLN